MTLSPEWQTASRFKVAKRCPDYDEDCKHVADHLKCWKGVETLHNGVIYFTQQADGYCPFVIGMEP